MHSVWGVCGVCGVYVCVCVRARAVCVWRHHSDGASIVAGVMLQIANLEGGGGKSEEDER